MDKSSKKEVIDSMFEALQVYEGDAIQSVDDMGEHIAVIPYYAHGRSDQHVVPLEAMAGAAYSMIIANQLKL